MHGIICIWSGSIATIPDGWALCDGTNGTPNLSNRFVLGSTTPSQIGDTGGTWNHVHENNHGTHSHDLQDGSEVQSGTGYAHTTTSSQVSTPTSSADHKPPWMKLAYIMKL